ncbi:uncharacterized protein ACLA_060290 [Aspergillus clavatus NRRL 1]|uniref:Glutamine amidotransferase type-2 domain-containing protein n=1 Tax=Aspergillus clavatus (strain ATCC 1007 / CBS 513.65 / DSM 816 / NCTC 3887 / NRRL 1 / QM 1276 / 107) TaxID=344612 RepID=A1C4M1_ASPCL|nr:uncharacterized protein ACLA_060290 [Aspergillus clavatus NRRL 1]EAW15361.1 hypothetical protein ACLA_060290 [Aspergillus clavatus NRRL 1]
MHTIVNGELYDHERHRAELSDRYDFNGQTDCEIAVALYKRYGLSCLSRHPATETKQFLAFGLQPKWDVARLRDQRWLYGAYTYLKGVRTIMPGQYHLSKNFGSLGHYMYWDMDFPDKAVQAVKLRLGPDVLVGVHLRGGIDSWAIAGIAAQLVTEQGGKLGNDTTKELSRVKCFTGDFDKESEVDESGVYGSSLRGKPPDTMNPRFPMLNGTGKLAMADMASKRAITGDGPDEHFASCQLLVLSPGIRTLFRGASLRRGEDTG